jgi:hypothetical protein
MVDIFDEFGNMIRSFDGNFTEDDGFAVGTSFGDSDGDGLLDSSGQVLSVNLETEVLDNLEQAVDVLPPQSVTLEPGDNTITLIRPLLGCITCPVETIKHLIINKRYTVVTIKISFFQITWGSLTLAIGGKKPIEISTVEIAIAIHVAIWSSCYQHTIIPKKMATFGILRLYSKRNRHGCIVTLRASTQIICGILTTPSIPHIPLKIVSHVFPVQRTITIHTHLPTKGSGNPCGAGRSIHLGFHIT